MSWVVRAGAASLLAPLLLSVDGAPASSQWQQTGWRAGSEAVGLAEMEPLQRNGSWPPLPDEVTGAPRAAPRLASRPVVRSLTLNSVHHGQRA